VVPLSKEVSTGAQARPVSAMTATMLVRVPTQTGTRVGSAFAWSGRLLLTNAHVVYDIPGYGEVWAERQGMAARLRLVARSGRMDLALLCQVGGDLPDAPAVRVEPVRPSEPIYAAGPMTLTAPARMVALRGQVSVTSQHDSRFGPGWIARLPGARHGFSGTPVLDGQGRLIGMLTAIRTGTDQGSAFVPARPASTAAGGPATQAFVLDAAAIRAEVARMLAEAWQGAAGSFREECPG
jgi:S1-C subfamily serine protease